MSTDMMNLVNLTVEESTNSTTQFFGPLDVMNIFNLLFGFPIYSYIIWLIVTGKGSGVVQEFFNLNLSLCDIGICLNSLFRLLEPRTQFTKLKTLISFLVGLGITGHPLFQALICVERYLAVVHPVTFLKLKPLRYRVICCAVVWILTFISCLVCMFTEDFYYITYSWFFSVQLLIFLSIQVFCVLAVLRALKQSGPGDRRREEENHMKRRAFIIILIATVSMTVIYMPFSVAGFINIVTNIYSPENFTVGFFCFLLAAFVQPVLYLKRVGKLSCCLFLKS